MPLIDYLAYEDAPERVRDALEGSAYAESEDRHLFYELLSNADAVLPARAEYFRTLMRDGDVPKREKELAYFAVAAVTDTRFVAATHGRYLVDEHGLDPAVVASVARGDLGALDPRDRAVVSFAATVARDPDAVNEADVDALRDAGYDDGQVVELLLLTCDAQSATSIVTAMDLSLADRGETEPSFLPDAFDL
ncbi:carboxymuconolactone decarboxylase family protein [Halorubellus salinus]|uniref:carboxymuconolactone decarboxylase family protein n=1 Tax=Halorubellus salinus TaxID=755309 RepID=UPI001D07D5C3|nr:carboxymuconolactone decarboxylase family protein [Halorubellus salinus]